MENLEKYTLVELRQLAKEKGVRNVSKLKKEVNVFDYASEIMSALKKVF